MDPSPEKIVVPAHLRKIDIQSTALPVRLKNVLSGAVYNGVSIRRFGDLHGLPYKFVAMQKYCGAKSIGILRDFLQNAKAGDLPLVPYYFSVPEKFRDLPLADLPITCRARNIFNGLNKVHLGDLHGMSHRQLEASRNCGRNTALEIQQMINRVVAGEFLPPDAASWTPEMLIPLLDALLEQLPETNRTVICLKLGAEDGRMMSCPAVALRVRISPSRASQIMQNIYRLPVLPLKAHLEALKNYCRHYGDMLSPEQISQWVGATPQRYSLSFYVRFISRLNPDIPVEGV